MAMKIGYILPLGELEETDAPRPYAELREMALQAEAAGFDSVWVYDHLLYRFPDQPTRGIWEGWTIYAALCEATERVELGQLVMCLPFRNPAMLAKMAITADEISGGRSILGLGAGWHEPEFTSFGLPYHHLGDQFEEGLRIIGPLLREGAVDFTGEFFAARNCEMRPRGPRPGGPPILVAAKGPRMLRLTAEHADMWNTAWFGRPSEAFHARVADMRAACDAVGRDPESLEITVGVNVAFPSLEPVDEAMNSPERTIQGTPEEIAAVFSQYESLGVKHLVCISLPHDGSGLAELSRALDIYRSA
jgi:alkanesulfonate monooxygenase SsuD/methylene tetrahydromethanopterin reductase-like flavin-dependent oxidoreductase (luciferase family)